MKILITGGYGFVGSHVSDRFYREGHEIFIVDNLTTGNKEHLKYKHRFYEMNIEDHKLEEVFKSNHFDVVVHLAAQKDTQLLSRRVVKDVRINVLGTVNLLNLASKYKVKRFIMISSGEVYDPSAEQAHIETEALKPMTETGLDKSIAEIYCRQWSETNGLSATILRLGSVYGPRQAVSTTGIPVSQWINTLLSGKELTVVASEQQQVDIIYIEDAADAIYRAANLKVNGTLNISGNKAIAVGEIFKRMSFLEQKDQVKFSKTAAVLHWGKQLDNSHAKQLLDWYPATTLEQGLLKTYEWLQDHQSQIEEEMAPEKESVLKRIFKGKYRRRLFIALELVIGTLFILEYKLSYMQRHISEPFDMGLVFIILMAVMYGSRMGIIAILLSVATTISTYFISGRDPMMLLYQTEFFMRMAFYVFVGFLIGYIKDKNEAEIITQKNQKAILEEKLEFATMLYRDMGEIRDELQSQIVNSEDSFGKIFSVVQTLDSLNPDSVFANAIKVIENLMKTDSVAIYKFSENSAFARLMANSDVMSKKLNKSIRIEDHPALVHVIRHRDIFVSKEVGPDKPVMAMPVIEGREIIGSIILYKSDFEKMTLSYQNYFKVIANLIASSLKKAYAYDNAIEIDRYLTGTDILKPQRFEELLRLKDELFNKNHVPYTLLKVRPESEPLELEELSKPIASILRDTDFMGINQVNELYIILSNTDDYEAKFVIERLNKIGRRVDVLGGEA